MPNSQSNILTSTKVQRLVLNFLKDEEEVTILMKHYFKCSQEELDKGFEVTCPVAPLIECAKKRRTGCPLHFILEELDAYLSQQNNPEEIDEPEEIIEPDQPEPRMINTRTIAELTRRN